MANIKSINGNPIVPNDGTVGTSALVDGAVTTPKLTAMAVTDSKTAVLGAMAAGLGQAGGIDISWHVGSVQSNGHATSADTKGLIPYAASCPVARLGDYVYVADGYKVMLRIYNQPILDTSYYVGSWPAPAAYVEGSLGIPKSAVGKYICPVVKRVDNADTNVDTDTPNIAYVRTAYVAGADPTVTTATVLDGKMSLPSQFGTLPFDIIRRGGRYELSVSADELVPNPVTVYVRDSSTETGDGTDPAHPITIDRWRTNRANGVYQTDSIRVKFLDRTYFVGSTVSYDAVGTGNATKSIMFEGSDGGMTWVAYGNKAPTWEQHEGSVYKFATNANVTDIVDLANLKPDGLPQLYTKVQTLDEVDGAGKFAYVDNVAYVWPHTSAESLSVVYESSWTDSKRGIITVRRTNDGSTVFKDVGFLADALNMRDLRSGGGWYYFMGCRFHRGAQDALALNGYYKAVLVDCGADHSSKDCFNYHSASKDSVAIELNCFAYGAGKAKMWDVSGYNTTTDSNNGSTAHDGMCVARFGCSYWDCEGAICADVNNVVTYNQEVECKDIISTISNANYKAAFMLHDNTGVTSPKRTDTHDNYLIACSGGGANVNYGFRILGMTAKVSGYEGVKAVNGDGTYSVDYYDAIV